MDIHNSQDGDHLLCFPRAIMIKAVYFPVEHTDMFFDNNIMKFALSANSHYKLRVSVNEKLAEEGAFMNVCLYEVVNHSWFKKELLYMYRCAYN